MKDLVISSGNWTSGGHFSGYDEELGRVHFYGNQMKAIGLTPESTITFPLFGRAEQRTFTDKEGKEFERLTAVAVYKTAKEFNAVKLAKDSLKLDYASQRKALLSAMEVTEADFASLIG